MTITDIARVCHEVNRAYCQSIGDLTQVAWIMAPLWQQNSAIQDVQYRLQNPKAGPADMHDAWCAAKVSEDWKHGPIKHLENKKHPCLVPYNELPAEQRVKDYLFMAVVESLKEELR